MLQAFYMNFASAIVVNGLMLLLGLISVTMPPKKPNMWYGYRTEKSMATLDNWKLANHIFARTSLLGSVCSIFIMIALYIIANFTNLSLSYAEHISCFIALIIPIVSILRTEHRLKKGVSKK